MYQNIYFAKRKIKLSKKGQCLAMGWVRCLPKTNKARTQLLINNLKYLSEVESGILFYLTNEVVGLCLSLPEPREIELKK
jgi:hypothetical protein